MQDLAPIASHFLEGDIAGTIPSLQELEAFGVFQSTQDLVAEYFLLRPSRPCYASTSSAPVVPSSRPPRRSRPSPPPRPLSTPNTSSNATAPALASSGTRPPPARVLVRSTARSTASLPGFLRAIRTGTDERRNSLQDAEGANRRQRPTPSALVTDPSILNGPLYAIQLCTEPSSATSSLSPPLPFSANPRRQSVRSSLSSELDECDSPPPPVRARRASKAARLFGASKESSSEDSYNGDGEGPFSEKARARPFSSAGPGSPTSPSTLWAKAFKLGLGGKKAAKRPSSLASDGSSAWEVVTGGDEDEPSVKRPLSFEVLHRRPTSSRSQSATAVEIASRGMITAEPSLSGLSGALSSSTPVLGNIEEFPEPLTLRGAPPNLDATPSGSGNLTPTPTPPEGNSPLSTPRPSRTTLDFFRTTPATAPPATSLLSANRPSPHPSPAPSDKTAMGALPLSLRTRELFLTERHPHEKSSDSDDDSSAASSALPASPTLPTSTTSSSFSFSSSSAPGTPELDPSTSRTKPAYRTSRSISPSALKRSTGSAQLARSPGPSDSDVSLVSTASSTNSDTGNDTPASSAAEHEDRGDLSPDEEAALVVRLSRGLKPSVAAMWQVKGKLRREVSDASASEVGSDLVPEDLEGGVHVW